MQLKKVDAPVTSPTIGVPNSRKSKVMKQDSENTTTENTSVTSQVYGESGSVPTLVHNSVYLVVGATKIKSAYQRKSFVYISSTWVGKGCTNKYTWIIFVYLITWPDKRKMSCLDSEEIPKNPGKFVTRHSASCHFGHMDAEAISYLGHLPQDLIGNSVLDFYHPEDMDLLKDIYEAGTYNL